MTPLAKSLKKLINFEFIMLLDIWCKILNLIDRVNRSLQAKRLSIDDAGKMVNGLTKSIQNLRDTYSYQDVKKFAKEMATKLKIEPNFPLRRTRKRKRMASEQAQDEGCMLPAEKKFDIECMCVFDRILAEIKSRFQKMEEVSGDFNFLTGQSLVTMTSEQLKECAMNLGSKYPKDLNAVEFSSEVETFKFQL